MSWGDEVKRRQALVISVCLARRASSPLTAADQTPKKKAGRMKLIAPVRHGPGRDESLAVGGHREAAR